MKISWGIKIAAVYIIFVLLVLGTVIFSTTQDVNLVAEDYYQKEIAYQQQIDKLKRTSRLSEKVFVKLDSKFLKIKMPADFKDKYVKGDLVLYRPSDNKQDFQTQLALNSNLEHTLSVENFEKGLWKLQLDWEADGLDYFHEQILMFN